VPPLKNGGYTASLLYWTPFSLDFGGIYVIGDARGKISGEHVIGNIGNNGKGNLRRRFGYTLLAISTLIIGNEISVVSSKSTSILRSEKHLKQYPIV
jgi:hypothetical protein